MIINIHWGEFCGVAERTEIDSPITANQKETKNLVFKYSLLLRGYLPFTLFKNLITREWMVGSPIHPSISKLVIFYTKKLIDEFEMKNKFEAPFINSI